MNGLLGTERKALGVKGFSAADLCADRLLMTARSQGLLCDIAALPLCSMQLRIGRPDAAAPDPEGRLPDENASAAQLKAAFADKGFGLRELVALSGAHTVGE